MRDSVIEIEAWAPTCGRCIAETVDGLIDCFVIPPRPRPSEAVEWSQTDNDPENLLGYLLDWVIYNRRVFARIPVTTVVERSNEWHVRCQTADLAATTQNDNAPKSIYVQAIGMRYETDGWHCTATLDTGTDSDELACTPAPETTTRIQHIIADTPSPVDP